MNTLPVTEKSCGEAVVRTARWARQAMAETSRAGSSFTALAWYKGLACFGAVGDTASARELLRRFERTGSRPGDFCPPEDMTMARALGMDGSGQTWSNVFSAVLRAPLGLWRNYRNAWIACGAERLGASELSAPALDFLANCISSARHAVPHNDLLDPAQRFYDIGTNASVAHAMLAGGRLEIATRLGEFSRNLIMSQSADAPRIHMAHDAHGQPLDAPDNKLIRNQYWLEVGAPDQIYWVLGFALKVFALLFKATGKSEWLDPANRILAWLGRCNPDFASNITCAKLSWGAAEMFAATGDKAWRDIAVKSIAYVAGTQTPDGIWIRTDYPWWLPQPLLVTLDTSVERMFYLREVPRSLREGGMPLMD